MNRIEYGDCREILKTFPSEVAHCCVTSPPYYGLRDYGHGGQIGLEQTPDEYVAQMVDVFREVRRVLRNDGTLWLNLGDSYSPGKRKTQVAPTLRTATKDAASGKQAYLANFSVRPKGDPWSKPKDLLGIPWRVAFALQQDGWYLRQDIIWHKPNPMPESVKDRCTKAHEYIFMFSKKPRYYYDFETIKESAVSKGKKKWTDNGLDKQRGHSRRHAGFNGRYAAEIEKNGAPETRNRRSVWTVSTKPFKGAHFATYPPDLIEPCILAGCPEGGIVLDPFMGSGTTAMVAKQHNRQYMGCELNKDYKKLIDKRLGNSAENFI